MKKWSEMISSGVTLMLAVPLALAVALFTVLASFTPLIVCLLVIAALGKYLGWWLA